MCNPGFSDRILSTLECSPRPPRAAVHSRTPVERTTNLIQYLHLQNFATADARTWLKHQNTLTAKRVQNPTSLNAGHARPPMASAPRARLHMPPAHPSERTCAGSPPLRLLHPPHSRPAARRRHRQPLLHAARAPGVPSTPSAARPSPTRLARLDYDSRRAPTARMRRATSFCIVLSRLQTRGQATRRTVSWHFSRGDGAAHAARRRRDRVEIAHLSRAGSSKSRTYVPPLARSVLENAHLASRESSERGTGAQKQAGGAMPAMRPARGWHGAARRLTWREQQRREARALEHRPSHGLHTY